MCNDHSHHHYDYPEIVQLMPVQKELYAVYHTPSPMNFAVAREGAVNLVPVLFMGLIRHGEKSMVEGFFASETINSCEEVQGFKGYASSLADAVKLYSE